MKRRIFALVGLSGLLIACKPQVMPKSIDSDSQVSYLYDDDHKPYTTDMFTSLNSVTYPYDSQDTGRSVYTEENKQYAKMQFVFEEGDYLWEEKDGKIPDLPLGIVASVSEPSGKWNPADYDLVAAYSVGVLDVKGLEEGNYWTMFALPPLVQTDYAVDTYHFREENKIIDHYHFAMALPNWFNRIHARYSEKYRDIYNFTKYDVFSLTLKLTPLRKAKEKEIDGRRKDYDPIQTTIYFQFSEDQKKLMLRKDKNRLKQRPGGPTAYYGGGDASAPDP